MLACAGAANWRRQTLGHLVYVGHLRAATIVRHKNSHAMTAVRTRGGGQQALDGGDASSPETNSGQCERNRDDGQLRTR